MEWNEEQPSRLYLITSEKLPSRDIFLLRTGGKRRGRCWNICGALPQITNKGYKWGDNAGEQGFLKELELFLILIE